MKISELGNWNDSKLYPVLHIAQDTYPSQNKEHLFAQRNWEQYKYGIGIVAIALGTLLIVPSVIFAATGLYKRSFKWIKYLQKRPSLEVHIQTVSLKTILPEKNRGEQIIEKKGPADEKIILKEAIVKEERRKSKEDGEESDEETTITGKPEEIEGSEEGEEEWDEEVIIKEEEEIEEYEEETEEEEEYEERPVDKYMRHKQEAESRGPLKIIEFSFDDENETFEEVIAKVKNQETEEVVEKTENQDSEEVIEKVENQDSEEIVEKIESEASEEIINILQEETPIYLTHSLKRSSSLQGLAYLGGNIEANSQDVEEIVGNIETKRNETYYQMKFPGVQHPFLTLSTPICDDLEPMLNLLEKEKIEDMITFQSSERENSSYWPQQQGEERNGLKFVSLMVGENQRYRRLTLEKKDGSQLRVHELQWHEATIIPKTLLDFISSINHSVKGHYKPILINDNKRAGYIGIFLATYYMLKVLKEREIFEFEMGPRFLRAQRILDVQKTNKVRAHWHLNLIYQTIKLAHTSGQVKAF